MSEPGYRRTAVGLLGSLLLVLVFAWVVRGLPDARQVTWTRLIVAVVLGIGIGPTVAEDPTVTVDLPRDDLHALDLRMYAARSVTGWTYGVASGASSVA